MMNRACKCIVFIFFLMLFIDLKVTALAEGVAIEGVIVRPVMEYKSDKLRDPFKEYVKKEEPKEMPQENPDLIKPELDLNKFKVQGIIWGGAMPQAIINEKVLKIGDLIEDAEILKIEKNGITLSFNREIYNLNAPGQESVVKKSK